MTVAIPREFLIERQGKQVVIYAGLLDALHRKVGEGGRLDVRTSLQQIGTDENGMTWVVHASVTIEQGTYEGLGDASPANVSRAMLSCLPRMAETRAKARAFRDALNIGGLMLADDPDEDMADERPAATRRAAPVDDGMEARLHPQPAAVAARAPTTTAMTKNLAEAWDTYRASLKRVREAGYKFSAIGETSSLETVIASTKVLDDKYAAHLRQAPPGARERTA